MVEKHYLSGDVPIRQSDIETTDRFRPHPHINGVFHPVLGDTFNI